MIKTPFFDAIERLPGTSGGRFHMPGHKGNPGALPTFAQLLRYDITEIEGADNLQNPTGPLLESQRNMAAAYGAGATLYSASGSTACIEAMLTVFCAPGARVVMGRNCHTAAVRAAAFLDLQPHWVLPAQGRIDPCDVDDALAQSGAGCVYLTSPDYYGRISDIAAIAAVCRVHGAALLVDNAHGAHLRFLPRDVHPLSLGADAACDSAHKTLACLTPAALLHLRDEGLAEAARAALNLYSSTSPAYPVLLSLDLAAGTLLANPPDFAAAGDALHAAAASVPGMALPTDDVLKLVLYPAGTGAVYSEVLNALRAGGLEPELCDGARIVLMGGPHNTDEDFARLAAVLARFAGGVGTAPFTEPPLGRPEAVLRVREAVFAPAQRVPTARSVGRIAAEAASPVPPCIPVVVPGERVDEDAARQMSLGGISALNVVK